MSSIWTIPILTYHRVGEPKGDHVPTVTPEAFEAQLHFLARHRYAVWDLPDLIAPLEKGEPIGRRSTAITFDDGYEETYRLAAPLLRRYGFRATVFVTPNDVGRPGFMTWDQVRSSAQDGLTIGSHTLHHTYLPLAARAQIQEELHESRRRLEAEIGRPVALLSYPVGGYTEEVQAIARQSGYRAAFTTNRGVKRLGYDFFALRRIKMTERDRYAISMMIKLSGYYDMFRQIYTPS